MLHEYVYQSDTKEQRKAIEYDSSGVHFVTYENNVHRFMLKLKTYLPPSNRGVLSGINFNGKEYIMLDGYSMIVIEKSFGDILSLPNQPTETYVPINMGKNKWAWVPTEERYPDWVSIAFSADKATTPFSEFYVVPDKLSVLLDLFGGCGTHISVNQADKNNHFLPSILKSKIRIGADKFVPCWCVFMASDIVPSYLTDPVWNPSFIEIHTKEQPEIKTVVIPLTPYHEGVFSLKIKLAWVCPTCGKPRGEIVERRSYDGSKCLIVDDWHNPCGHIDYYSSVRVEAAQNGLN